ncbi:hypothetical protein QMG25_13565 [Arthrobacter sp. H35-D1]|nr:hypothetical protein [Arthrobacter sp. H35-D1]
MPLSHADGRNAQQFAAVRCSRAGRDASLAIIAADPMVFDQNSSRDWQEGMLPSPGAPVWPMSAFRDQILTAYSTDDGTSGRPQ